MKNLLLYFVCGLFAFALPIGLGAQNEVLGERYFLQANDFRKIMKSDSALVYYEKAAIEFKKNGSVKNFVDAYNQKGIILTRQDKYSEAKLHLNEALQVGISALDSNDLSIATTYISLGVIFNAEGDYAQALLYHHKSLKIRQLKLGEEHAEVASSYGNIGNVYRNNKEFDKSIEAHHQAMKIREKNFGVSSAEIIESYLGLGNAHREKKEFATALNYFEKALNNKIIQRGEGHKDLIRFYKYISEVYYLMDNKIKGDEYKSKWEAIGA